MACFFYYYPCYVQQISATLTFLFKNICSEKDAERLFDTLNINYKHCFIEVFYSGNEYDYKGNNQNDLVDATERIRRIDILKKVGKRHALKF
jgi:hypothetical protein